MSEQENGLSILVSLVFHGYGELQVILILVSGLPGPERIAAMVAGAGTLQEIRF